MATVPRLLWYYQGATTSCSACPSAYCFASQVRGCLPGSCLSRRAHHHAGLTTGRDIYWSRWPSLLQRFHPRQKQDLPGFLAPHTVTLRRSATPDDPSHLACNGAAGAVPRMTTLKTSSLQLSGLTPSLHHPLFTLHDGCYHSPCKTRFRLAGCAFTGRESNPLGCDKRFQIISSSFPGLTLTLDQFWTSIDTPGQDAYLDDVRHGLRVSEVEFLKWDLIDLKAARIHVNLIKNGNASTH